MKGKKSTKVEEANKALRESPSEHAEPNRQVNRRAKKEVKLKPPTELGQSLDQGNQGRGPRIVVPDLTPQESHVIMCRCLWKMVSDKQAQDVISNPSEQFTFAFVGSIIGHAGYIGKVEIIVAKSNVIKILDHPERKLNSELVEQAYREIFSQVFEGPPFVVIS